jgi:hypothetical protein
MRDPAFRASQLERLRDAHVAPIYDLVDELRRSGRGWLPYVAPIYGGVRAEMLHVFRDPGPMANAAARGSGFLCLETLNQRLGLRLGRSATDVLVECGTHREAGVCQTFAGVASGEVDDHRCLNERDAIDVNEGQQAPADRIQLAEGGIDHTEQFCGQDVVVGLQDA